MLQDALNSILKMMNPDNYDGDKAEPARPVVDMVLNPLVDSKNQAAKKSKSGTDVKTPKYTPAEMTDYEQKKAKLNQIMRGLNGNVTAETVKQIRREADMLRNDHTLLIQQIGGTDKLDQLDPDNPIKKYDYDLNEALIKLDNLGKQFMDKNNQPTLKVNGR